MLSSVLDDRHYRLDGVAFLVLEDGSALRLVEFVAERDERGMRCVLQLAWSRSLRTRALSIWWGALFQHVHVRSQYVILDSGGSSPRKRYNPRSTDKSSLARMRP